VVRAATLERAYMRVYVCKVGGVSRDKGRIGQDGIILG
jgi:hypothetical protein